MDAHVVQWGMQYLKKRFSVAMPSQVSQEDWDRCFGKAPRRRRGAQGLTLKQLDARAERIARAAGLSGAAEAFRRLNAGELDGTLLEMELRMIRFLQNAKDATPAPAPPAGPGAGGTVERGSPGSGGNPAPALSAGNGPVVITPTNPKEGHVPSLH
jgi:hypothetical protein